MSLYAWFQDRKWHKRLDKARPVLEHKLPGEAQYIKSAEYARHKTSRCVCHLMVLDEDELIIAWPYRGLFGKLGIAWYHKGVFK